ncbi:MAG: Sensor histidine kinase RcsC [Anaerolineae bacterium]|nr:Sensor histidine kinase RcsC [Anaerolineae bacterium]
MTFAVEQIFDICQQIVSSLDSVEVAQNAVTLVQSLVGKAGVALWLQNDDYLEVSAVAGAPLPFPPGTTRPLESAVTADTPPFELWLPVKFGKKELGRLSVYSARQSTLDALNRTQLEIVAGFVGTALQNAHRFSAMKQIGTPRQAEADDLYVSEELFRQVVASVSAHIYVTEVTTGDKLINHYIAPNVEPLTGYPHEKFITDWGFWPNEVIYPEDRPLAAAQFLQLRQGLTSTAEYRLRRADGQVIWVRDSGRVEPRGNSRMIYGVVSDITDRKEAELALERERALLADRVAERTSELSAANAKLARAARLKDEFLANMSHELRTPLNAILGMAEVLQSGVYGQLNDEQLNAAKHIQESGTHLLALITDILDLSKIEAEKLTLDIGPAYIDFVCEASLRMVVQVAKQKQIKVVSQFDERVKSIQADQRRLKQILVNLLSNAVKFTPEGGQVGLYVQGDREREVVRFIVWDTGIGIAPEDMSELFKPFVQLDSKLSRQHEGTGLGLSLVARLAELHGGGVAVESELGRGSRFTVSLPWHESAVETPAADATPADPVAEPPLPEEAPAAKTPPLILLAEDNEANVITLTEFLTNMDYRVIVARNGKEAIARAAEERPDIILMDVQMPGMDGLEAMRQIRADGQLSNLPIIALTALAMPGDRELCLEAGANDYLSKPVGLRRLMNAIEAQLHPAA